MPALTEAALLAADARGNPIVSVHVKRTFHIREDGTCVRTDEQQPLLNSDVDAELVDDGIPRELDIWPPKGATDLIVMAAAHGLRGKKTRRMSASIEVGELSREYVVQGDRRCLHRSDGTVEFSRPEAFETIPLRYERAYGGADPTVPVPQPTTVLDGLWPHPGIYPRNPAGRGYVASTSRDHIEGLLLPNVEHPRDRLTPRRLIGAADKWWLQPVPWSCDWYDASWYPRCVFFGALPEHLPEDDQQMWEVRSGYLPSGQRQRSRLTSIDKLVHPRCGDAASPALVLPFMRGDEAIRFRGMTRSGELVVRLPGRPPKIHLRSGRRAEELPAVPHRILVSLEERGLSIVWQASWAAPRALVHRTAASADAEAPLRGVSVVADGRVVPALD